MPELKVIDLWNPEHRLLPYHRYLAFLEKSRSKKRESLLLCEHRPCITAGLQSKTQNLLSSLAGLTKNGIEYIPVQRAGDHTAHEPGQLVIYIHLNLHKRQLKLKTLFDTVLEISSQALFAIWQLNCQSQADAPGLYCPDGKKILSIGLDYRQHFSGYGISLNVSNTMNSFNYIHTCGYQHLQTTSIVEQNKKPNLSKAFCQHWLKNFLELYN